MSVHARSNRTGVDGAIYRIQNYLNDNLTWASVDIYGRCEKILDVNRKSILRWFDSNKEYPDVLVTDKRGASIGFYVKGYRKVQSNSMTVDVKIICTINIETVYRTKFREDEKALLEVYNLLLNCKKYGLNINDTITTGNEDVFKDFDKEKIAYRDTHPYFNFAFECELRYNTNLCLT